jgi:hypothetical protein
LITIDVFTWHPPAGAEYPIKFNDLGQLESDHFLLGSCTKGRPRYINQLSLYLLIQAAIAGIDTIDGDFAATHIAAHPFYQQTPEA